MTALEELISKVGSDPGARHQAVKTLHRFCRDAVGLLVASEELARAASLEDAHRGALADIDRAAVELANVKRDIEAHKERRDALAGKLAVITKDIGQAEAKLHFLEDRVARASDVAADADAAELRVRQATQRLEATTLAIADADRRMAEIRKTLGLGS